MFEVWE